MGHSWRSKDKLKIGVLLWTPTPGHTSIGRPAKTYIHQHCADTGCSLEDLPGSMDDKDGWRAREIERERKGARGNLGIPCCQRDLVVMVMMVRKISTEFLFLADKKASNLSLFLMCAIYQHKVLEGLSLHTKWHSTTSLSLSLSHTHTHIHTKKHTYAHIHWQTDQWSMERHKQVSWCE